MAEETNKKIERAPIVVIMGHIDHGKSTLLDTIRKSNIVEGEAGGITQHISSYEVQHKSGDGKVRKITFLDTPGHEAFSQMRSRGAHVADIAILIVSAEDGVKAQTLEALEAIKQAEIPFIVAINKIDKPGANLVQTQSSLIENGIYIEGMGGDIPWAPISAKAGTGIDELLDLLLLAADIEELSADPSINAKGVVIESNIDTKKGVSATLIIEDGTIKSGMCVVVGDCIAPVRIMEDFLGKKIKEATFSSPIRITGFNCLPEVGAQFRTYQTKKEAEKVAAEYKELVRVEKKSSKSSSSSDENEGVTVIPLVIKTDVLGTLDAIKHEIEKIELPEHIEVRIVQEGAGSISENDVKSAGGKDRAIIVGFNVSVDSVAKDLAERAGIEIETFSIIYELAEWLEGAVKTRTPKRETLEVTSRIKILKEFSMQKNRQVLGGRIEYGSIKLGDVVRVLKNKEEVDKGKVTNLQTIKEQVKEISAPAEFGMEITCDTDIKPGDYIESFVIEMK
jgi:translation initiation factor IF-2